MPEFQKYNAGRHTCVCTSNWTRSKTISVLNVHGTFVLGGKRFYLHMQLPKITKTIYAYALHKAMDFVQMPK